MDFLQLPPDLSGPALWLPLVWAGIIALAVAMYVLLDGLDLGIGIMFTAAENENWRDRMMLSVAPVWDFNETWLILGGAGLFAVFHVAYAVLMPALYVPILLMLTALIFRGGRLLPQQPRWPAQLQIDAVAPFAAHFPGAACAARFLEAEPLQEAERGGIARIDVGHDRHA